MAAAQGPPCVGCGKKQSKQCIPRCFYCQRVLCWQCPCPTPYTVRHGPPDRRREVEVNQSRSARRKL